MNEILTFTADEVTPPRAAVFENQGIPAEAVVQEGVDELYRKALVLFVEAADCAGISSQISQGAMRPKHRSGIFSVEPTTWPCLPSQSGNG